MSVDDEVLTVLRDEERRARLGPDDVPGLAAFGQRQSVTAVRQGSRDGLLWGFLAVAVSFDLNGGDREGAFSMPALWHSASLLGVTAEETVAFLVEHGVSRRAADKVHAYSRQDHLRALDYMNLRPSGHGADFDYVRARRPSPPPMP